MRPLTAPADARTTLKGILLALGGSATLSINDVAIKFLSGDYALHQVILIRASIGISSSEKPSSTTCRCWLPTSVLSS